MTQAAQVSQAGRADPRATPRPGPQGYGLREAVSEFFGHPSPRVLVPASAAAIGLRAALGGWRRRDLAIAAGILGAEPFTEWIIHVFVLHLRPRTIRGRFVDPLLSRKHRAHHQDPRDAELVFVPMPVIRAVLPVAVVGWSLAERRLRPALTGIATSYAMLTAYEWTHFLIHSSYRPRHRPYRTIWRAHRLHHYRNEHYWFGVTMHLGDRVLGTYPGRDSVPLSTTARTLGVDA
jgi:sterol desaturase/sphingolipid hydroxylase (fatty acid hydroxylase superfamily)